MTDRHHRSEVNHDTSSVVRTYSFAGQRLMKETMHERCCTGRYCGGKGEKYFQKDQEKYSQ
jgi:hypothetical protein